MDERLENLRALKLEVERDRENIDAIERRIKQARTVTFNEVSKIEGEWSQMLYCLNSI